MKRAHNYCLRDSPDRKFPPWLGNPVRDGKVLTTRFINIDSFDSIKYLCEGRRSQVVLARLKASGRYYVLRGVKKKWMFKYQAAEEVRREASIHLHLQSKFIVNLFRVFDHHSFVYFVQEFCIGGTLGILRQRSIPRLIPPKIFGPDSVRFYVAEIASAIQHMHDRRIIYRNLLPENVGLAWNGHVKLLGFGHATEFKFGEDTIETTDKVCALNLSSGAPEFLPPSYRNKIFGSVDFESLHSYEVDWWALGILMFQLVYGYDPFGTEVSEDEEVVCKRILTNRRVRWPLWADAIEQRHRGSGVLQVINGLLTFDPLDRWKFDRLKESKLFAMIGDWALLHHIEAPCYPRDYLVAADTSCYTRLQRKHHRVMKQPGATPEELQVRPKDTEVEYCYFTHTCKEVMADAVSTCTIRARSHWNEGQISNEEILHDEGLEYSAMFKRLEHGLNKKDARVARRQQMFSQLKEESLLPKIDNDSAEWIAAQEALQRKRERRAKSRKIKLDFKVKKQERINLELKQQKEQLKYVENLYKQQKEQKELKDRMLVEDQSEDVQLIELKQPHSGRRASLTKPKH